MVGNRTTLSFEIENLRLFNSKLHNMGLFSFITNSKISYILLFDSYSNKTRSLNNKTS